jgi:peptidoglycan/LPS O-acetylase OafA/YrhL
MRPDMQQQGFRVDIQGLRAIAVLLVLAFHVWPSAMTGGYIGVDVFFVISGFLITGLLVREFERNGTISLRAFYARRIRRLLPAASLTLVAIAAASAAWLPQAQWSDIGKEILAAGFYVQNLLLVRRSVDYLALEEAPSPVQHYWSLSIEEQFYVLWPMVMLAAGWYARRSGLSVRKAFAVSLSAITGLSLAWGIYKSYTDPAPGYFLTTTRLWELGVGGLLSLYRGNAGGGWRSAAFAWGGIGAIAFSGVVYTTGLPFPGYEALLPTLGTAALIFAAAPANSVAGRFVGLRPMQYFGDISYSLYLWHWPVVVFYPYVTGSEIANFADATTVVVLSIALAHVSKYQIEDRFRHAPEARRETVVRTSFAMGAACMALIVAAGAFQWSQAPSQGAANALSSADYPGAAAFVYDAPVKAGVAPTPDTNVAKVDRGPAYGGNGLPRCIADMAGDELFRCDYGKPGGFRIVVVGDSHAMHWLPAFERAADDAGWNVTALTKNGCAFADLTVQFGSPGQPQVDFVDCDRWKRKVLAWLLAEKPDLVVISESPNHRTANMPAPMSQDAIARGVVAMADQLVDAHIPVALIKHTPWLKNNAPNCMAKPGATADACGGPRDQALRNAALNRAARMDPRLTLLSFDDAFCKGSRCPVVIGNVFVYRDQHHMTATFSRTLAPVLEERLSAAYPNARAAHQSDNTRTMRPAVAPSHKGIAAGDGG